MNRSVEPTFLIIGAAKCGTTTLHCYLSGHPEIYMSDPKETNYFGYRPGEREPRIIAQPSILPTLQFTIRQWPEYINLFQPGMHARAIGETSPFYLESLYAPNSIKQRLPGAKIVVTLRNPIDTAISQYRLMRRNNYETRSFSEAIKAQDHIVQTAFYAFMLKRYYDLFDRKQIFVMIFEDWTRNPDVVLSALCEFLGVDPGSHPKSLPQLDPGRHPRSLTLHRVLLKLGGRPNSKYGGSRKSILNRLCEWNMSYENYNISAADRCFLSDIYHDQIGQLEELCGLPFRKYWDL